METRNTMRSLVRRPVKSTLLTIKLADLKSERGRGRERKEKREKEIEIVRDRDRES